MLAIWGWRHAPQVAISSHHNSQIAKQVPLTQSSRRRQLRQISNWVHHRKLEGAGTLKVGSPKLRSCAGRFWLSQKGHPFWPLPPGSPPRPSAGARGLRRNLFPTHLLKGGQLWTYKVGHLWNLHLWNLRKCAHLCRCKSGPLLARGDVRKLDSFQAGETPFNCCRRHHRGRNSPEEQARPPAGPCQSCGGRLPPARPR
jgi:hypothetical protein